LKANGHNGGEKGTLLIAKAGVHPGTWHPRTVSGIGQDPQLLDERDASAEYAS
jgi:hypothetical protein